MGPWSSGADQLTTTKPIFTDTWPSPQLPTTTMDALPSPYLFAELPEDLGRIIFELVAEHDGPSCALVSKGVKSW
jgi:hypothetical protein